jgi:hypothetical protein
MSPKYIFKLLNDEIDWIKMLLLHRMKDAMNSCGSIGGQVQCIFLVKCNWFQIENKKV